MVVRVNWTSVRFLTNVASIGQVVAEFWRFIGFKNGYRSPSWIFKKFKILTTYSYKLQPSFIEIRSVVSEPRVSKFALPITVNIGFYNSLHYLTSRDVRRSTPTARVGTTSFTILLF